MYGMHLIILVASNLILKRGMAKYAQKILLWNGKFIIIINIR